MFSWDTGLEAPCYVVNSECVTVSLSNTKVDKLERVLEASSRLRLDSVRKNYFVGAIFYCMLR